MERIFIVLPSGIGDAIQSLVGFCIVESYYKEATIVVLVEPNIINLLSKQFPIIDFVSNRSLAFFESKQQFDLLIDFNGLPWLKAKCHVHKFHKTIAHTCFTDKAIMNGADCIYVDDIAVKNSIFFDANGYEPKPAWTLYAKMAMLALPQDEASELLSLTQPVLTNKKSTIRRAKSSGKSVIGLFPGGSSKEKHWPISNLLKFIKLIKGNKTDVRVFIARSELCYMKHFVCQGIKVIFNQRIDKIYNFNRDLDFVMANDTGLMHISGALGIGTLGIFLETTPKVWFTYLANDQGFIKNPKYQPKRRYQSSPSVFDVYRYANFLQAQSRNSVTQHKQFRKLGRQISVRD
jgi:ADP-heptose:LPS heptosyltransferase